MLVLQIFFGLVVFSGIIWGLFTFDNHCENKFDYRFFTTASFLIVGASLILILLGNGWRLNSIQQNGDILNGMLVMGVGGIISLFLVYLNFKSTNIIYGFGGSAVQVLMFGALAYFGAFILIIGLALTIFGSMGGQRVFVVNK